jgi:serine protease Do
MTRPVRAGVIIGLGLWLAAAVLAEEPPESPEAARARRRTPIVDVFERCRDAVVNISTTRVVRMQSRFDSIFDFGTPRFGTRRVQSVGSGLVVHESGYIVTNAHVVSQASDAQATFADKQTLPARIVAVDTDHDLAVLKVDAPKPLAHLRLGRSDDLMIGETVIAIGNPLGLQHTVTSGIISALDRELPFSEDVVYSGLIQTDAPINPGNSGGPLLNIDGELIGINTAIRGDAQNIGFAIPVDRLWSLLPSLLDIEQRERVRFGLEVSGHDARVTAVRADTPAAQAGLRTGDRIVKFNGEALRDGIDYYVHLLSQKPESKVRLAVRREQKTLDVEVPLQAIPLPDGAKLARERCGVELEEITADMRRRYELPAYVGLMVKSVVRGSPAERVRIVPTDFLLRVNRTPVTSLQDVGLALEQIKSGDKVGVEGLRVDADPPFLWTATLRAK